MRELFLVLTAVIIVILVGVVFVIMYINHSKINHTSHKPTIIYYKANRKDESVNAENTESKD